MLKTVQGVYHNGKIELAEEPDEVRDKTRVIVTFLEPSPALVVQADNLQSGVPQVIVAMITSRMFRANHPSRVPILSRSRKEG